MTILRGPLALSGLLSLWGSSCTPELPLMADGLRGNEPLTCSVRDLPLAGEEEDDLKGIFDRMAATDVAPDTFHLENKDRFQSLASSCSIHQLALFDGLQSDLGARISRMNPADIYSQLDLTYRQAYVYDESTGTMAPGDSPEHKKAKQTLDLWIAAIDRRAFEDSAFLDRIWGEKRIRTVMALNSPHLNPHDRGTLEQMFRAEPGGDEALTRLSKERPMEGIVRLLDWLKTYDGRSERFMEDAYWRSQLELYTVVESHFDYDRMLRLAQTTFPHEAVAQLMNERGYGPLYQRFLDLSSEALIQRYHESSLALTPQARFASRRQLVTEIQIMGIVFEQRGIDPRRELERRGIEAMTKFGFSQDDAELMTRLQTGGAPYTHDRLDDYRARHGLLGEYRTLYRDMVTQPLREVFSRENRSRYGMWGNFVLNRSLMKIPIFLEDLDRARWDITREVSASIRYGSPGLGFDLRDTTEPQWFTPADLGLCQSFTGGPLVVAGLARFNGQTANDLICNNVELMAFLPNDLEVEHALASAIGVFGVITVRNSDSALVNGRSQFVSWTPGALIETLTHEASHIDWFRQNFDRDSQRLPMLALNERRAYATGAGYLKDYSLSGLSHPGEAAHLGDRLQFVDEVVDAANRMTGVDSGQQGKNDPDYWDPSWDSGDPARFMFQPPDALQAERGREMLRQRFPEPSPDQIKASLENLLTRSVQALRLTDEEMRQLNQAFELLLSPSNASDGGVYFLPSHPLTRVVAQMNRDLGQFPPLIIDMNAKEWTQYLNTLARYQIDQTNWEDLMGIGRPRPRTLPDKPGPAQPHLGSSTTSFR